MRNVIEKGSNMAASLAARRFDLDHIGPEVAEQLAAELAFFVCQFQDSQPRKGPWLFIGHWSISS